MQVPVIKKLVEIHSVEALEEAEAAILDEQAPTIEIEGEDDGEQLTHVMAAIWIIEKMEKDQIPFGKAMREYTAKVRESIN
ncbi:hypothetical protein [Reichenbachiella sp. MALMAid0571]|uniref:DUF6952 family protein n=1 Tax=Reichenbachiella sp. MALMAid0571 TaxID=3143939 RepID=UPI0032DE32BE